MAEDRASLVVRVPQAGVTSCSSCGFRFSRVLSAHRPHGDRRALRAGWKRGKKSLLSYGENMHWVQFLILGGHGGSSLEIQLQMWSPCRTGFYI